MTAESVKDNSILSFKAAAETLGISRATLKNWIRLGKIDAIRQGSSYVFTPETIKNCELLLEEKRMLRSRRNKRLHDSNYLPKSYIDSSSPNFEIVKAIVNEASLCNESLEDILFYYETLLMKKRGLSSRVITALTEDYSKEPAVSNKAVYSYEPEIIPLEDTLGFLYLSLRSLKAKKASGAYYTPFFAVDLICNSSLQDHSKGQTICDPACGSGNFLIRLPADISPQDIFGFDIDPVAIRIARINLAIKHKVTELNTIEAIKRNISCCDFLSKDVSESFDITIGNPPWGYEFSSQMSDYLRKNFFSAKGSGRPESFSLFLEKALSLSKSVSFLVPESILESKTHTGIREFILKTGELATLSYLGEIFDKVQCPCIILTTSSERSSGTIKVEFYNKKKKELIKTASFYAPSSRISSDSFHILADEDSFRIIQKMESTGHFTLKANAKFALGIVSGGNNSLLSSKNKEGLEGVIKGTDISKFCLKAPSSFISFKPNALQQVAPEHFYRQKPKLVYKFIAKEPIVAIDETGYFTLNSANIIIPDARGYSPYYIMGVLNSSCIGFYYRKTCRNMKVLRAKLEALPIPFCSEEKMKELADLSRMLSKSSDDKLLETLNLKVAELFHISPEEYKAISSKY